MACLAWQFVRLWRRVLEVRVDAAREQ